MMESEFRLLLWHLQAFLAFVLRFFCKVFFRIKTNDSNGEKSFRHDLPTLCPQSDGVAYAVPHNA